MPSPSLARCLAAVAVTLAVAAVVLCPDHASAQGGGGGSSLQPPVFPHAVKAVANAVALPGKAVYLGGKAIFNAFKKSADLLFADKTGTLVGATGKRYESAEPMDIDEVTVSLRVVDFKGGIEATVYSADKQDVAAGKRTVLATLRVGAGEEAASVTRSFTGLRDRYVGVALKGTKAFKKAKYVLRAERPGMAADRLPLPPSEAAREKVRGHGPVCGIADAHTHVFAEFSFGGVHFDHSMEDPNAPDAAYVPKVKQMSVQPNQILTRNLRQAHHDGVNFVVSAAVNNELLCGAQLVLQGLPDFKHGCNDMANALRQTRAAIRYAKRHSDWVSIVRDPWEARQAIHEGKLAVMLAVEVSALFPAKRGDWKDQLHELYDMGVRSVFLVHQFDNDFAGAAPHGLMLEAGNGLVNKPAGFKRGPDGFNVRGLTQAGRELVTEMYRLRMIIDLAHLSRHTARDVRDLLKELVAADAHRPKDVPYPMVGSHMRVGPLLNDKDKKKLEEFYAAQETLDMIKASGGILGIRNGAERMLSADPQRTEQNNCDGSTVSVMQMAIWADKFGLDIAMGTDMNGHAAQQGPRLGAHACPTPPKFGKRKVNKAYRQKQVDAQLALNKWVGSAYDTAGLAHYGLVGDFVRDMHNLGGPITSMANSAELMLRVWERAHGVATPADAGLYSPDGRAAGSLMKCADYTKMHEAGAYLNPPKAAVPLAEPNDENDNDPE